MAENDLSAGMHDNPQIFPTLPGRASDANIRDYSPDDTDEWRTCWEFKLTHALTEGEGSAFWHGASLMRAALLDEIEAGRNLRERVEALAAEWEADDQTSLDRFGQHQYATVFQLAGMLRDAIAEVTP